MADEEPIEGVRELDVDTVIELRDAAKREVDIRVVPWDTVISHQFGPEAFVRGAFQDVDPRSVRLIGPQSDGTHRGPLIGRGMALQERDDGAYMTFKVSKTQAGDEALALLDDEVVRGASPGFIEKAGGTSLQQRDGRRVRTHGRVDLDHVALTHRPAYPRAEVIAMRSDIEVIPVPEDTAPAVVPTPEPVFPAERFMAFMEKMEERSQLSSEQLIDRIARIEERNRQDIVIPTPGNQKKSPKVFDWVEVAFRTIRGENVPARELQTRALDDVMVVDNPGQVPDAFVNDVVGLFQNNRPFMETTTEIPAPDTGMTIVVPVINQHATADVQNAEKDEIESTATKVGLESFDAVTVIGGADVSIQLIRRATRATMDLLFQDIAVAYAKKADRKALDALFTAGTTPGTANLDPENLLIGEAWENSINAFGEPPDTIWLSAAAVSLFIDAKNDGSNAPLYFTLNANISAGNLPSGNVSALRPVYVPALTGTSVDVIIGPRRGFVWAEDGTFQLQADNPTLAGRDIALGGILFYVPRYPTAFTTYNTAS